jgi:dehydrogenase/reductase SDR family member 7B
MREEFKNLDFSMIESMTNINLLSQIAATKAALPGMTKRKTGAIINISSVSGFFGQPVRTLYSATKFGLAGFGKALRSEVKGDGIQVMQVYPGYVQTNISKNAMTGSGGKFGKVDSNIKNGLPVSEACEQIIKALVVGRTEFIVGDAICHVLPYILQWEWLISKLTDK